METVSVEIEKRNLSSGPRDSSRKFPYDRFKRTDKLKVMELLLENETILQLIYQTIFKKPFQEKKQDQPEHTLARTIFRNKKLQPPLPEVSANEDCKSTQLTARSTKYNVSRCPPYKAAESILDSS